jgi:glycerol-3-phosphate acyltransferase PlsX
MIIALDVMGGDYAPEVNVQGLKIALADFPDITKFLLVGDEKAIRRQLKDNNLPESDRRYEIVHASQVVGMDEPSATGLRAKKDSSITVCADLMKKGACQAVVSAGHTGAAVACSVVKNRMLPGVDRPGIATTFPSSHNQPFIIMDVGANVDCKPLHLAQYAILAEAFAQVQLKKENPRIGLMSVGAEDGKGNDLTKTAFKMISKLPVNFYGNIEGRYFFDDEVDVVICDGFVGNAVLKACEGLARSISKTLKDSMRKTPMRMAGALLSKNAFTELREMWDHEEYGGAPLLGINGICIIAHGSSSPWAIRNAIRVARGMIVQEMNSRISEKIAAVDWPALLKEAEAD